jgi:hypothetical protein
MNRWWNGLTNKGRLLTGAGGVAALLIAGALIAPDSSNGSVSADTAVQRTASASPTPTPTPTPVVTIENIDVSEAIPFDAVTVDDAGRDIGQDAVTTTGQDGTRVKTYEVTYTDGIETSRSLAGEAVAAPPVQQVTSRGTRQPYVAPAPAPAPAPAAQGCDSNYSGACVPVASDVDCDGGSGNGPAYVRGPVTVVGYDIYDLDRDGDGIACD